MKTYAEIKHEKTFNWRTVLIEIIHENEDNGEIPIWKQEDLITEAKSWVTCACGNQCAIFPRFDNGMPKDEILQDLGMDFYEEIKAHKYHSALKLLHEIEQRSSYLLQYVFPGYQPLASMPAILL